MSNEMSSSSIKQEVEKRLDDIFGMDEVDNLPAKSVEASPLTGIKDSILAIDREINDQNIISLKLEVERLKRSYSDDTHVVLLLKIISSLMDYLKANKVDVYPDTLRMLNSVFKCMERVVEDQGISENEKRSLIAAEIKGFKKFKARIHAAKKLVTKKPAPVKKEPVTKTQEPVPAVEFQEPSPLVESPEPEPVMEPSEPGSVVAPPEQAPAMESPLPAAQSGKVFAAIKDLRSFMGKELAVLKGQINELRESHPAPDGFRDHMSKEFEALKRQIDQLRADYTEMDNLRSFTGKEFEALKGQINELKKDNKKTDDSLDLTREFKALKDQINEFKGGYEEINSLRSFINEELTALKSNLKGFKEDDKKADDSRDYLNREFEALKGQIDELKGGDKVVNELRAFMGEEFEALKGQVNELKEEYATSGDPREYLSNEFKELKDQMEILKGEVDLFRDALLISRSDIKDIKGIVTRYLAAAPSDEVEQENGAPKEAETPSMPLEQIDLDVLEKDHTLEEAAPVDTPEDSQTDDGPALKAGEPEAEEELSFDSPPGEEGTGGISQISETYFLFQMGGKKYAINERNVIKVCKVGGRLRKKAKDKGGLTILDCKGKFSSLKSGIEPQWQNLTSDDLTKTMFQLITDDRIDGLLDTRGGAVLFMGSEDRRTVLLTDDLPKKRPVSNIDRIETSSDREFLLGSIKKGDNDDDEYMIFDPEQLSKRLRIWIPAPFTKI